jgi:hypothetical protein
MLDAKNMWMAIAAFTAVFVGWKVLNPPPPPDTTPYAIQQTARRRRTASGLCMTMAMTVCR